MAVAVVVTVIAAVYPIRAFTTLGIGRAGAVLITEGTIAAWGSIPRRMTALTDGLRDRRRLEGG